MTYVLRQVLEQVALKKKKQKKYKCTFHLFFFPYDLPIWLLSITGFCGCGNIVDGFPVDGRASNGAGLAGDRLICL